MEGNKMKRGTIRLLYVILGFIISVIAALEFTSQISGHPIAFTIVFVVIGIVVALMVEASLETDSKKIFYLMFFAIVTPFLAYVFQYVIAAAIMLWKVLKIVLDIWF